MEMWVAWQELEMSNCLKCLIRTVNKGCAAETEMIREAESLRGVYELTCLQCALWGKVPFPHSCARPRTNAVEKDGGCSLKAKVQKKTQEKKLEVSRCNREDVSCLSLTVRIINCSRVNCLLMTCASARYIPSFVCGSPGGEAQYQSETDREQFPRQHFHNIKCPLFVSFAATARFGWSRRGSPSQGIFTLQSQTKWQQRWWWRQLIKIISWLNCERRR